jgi:N-acetylmuramoyl-L-alanine amidase
VDKSLLVIHCSDTPNGRVTTAREIDRWHAARTDMGQRDEEAILRFAPQYPYVGYHGVIYLDGHIERTRAETEKGSHTVGHNADGLGFCLIGTDAFTLEQWESLAWLVQDCRRRWAEDMPVKGHRDFSTKTCPGFDVAEWLDGDMKPLPGHILSLPSNPLSKP